MFETNDRNEIVIPFGLLEPGLHAWSCINLRLHVPWFHVVYRVTYIDGTELCFTTYILEREQLIELRQTKGIDLVETSLVSPGHLNGKQRWCMDPLAEIWKAIEPGISHGQEADIYVLSDGSRYVDSAFDTTEDNLLNAQLVFRAD